MAKHVFTFPDVGEGIHEGQLVEWLAQVGEEVEEDQPLCRVETDKAVVEIPSPVKGKLLEQHGEPGELIYVGNPLAVFEVAGGSADAAASSAQTAPAKAPAVATQKASHLGGQLAPAGGTAPSPGASSPPNLRVVSNTPQRPQDVRATPHTRALARKLGVDITMIAGTGRSGRITDEDVEAFAQGGGVAAQPGVAQTAPQLAPVAAQPAPAKAPAPTPLQTEDGPVERVPLSFLRRKIAEQMRLSTERLVHVTHVEEADVTELFEVYAKAKALLVERDIKLTPLSYFVKAIVTCLKEYPIFNSSYDQATGELIYKKYYNIGMAVDTPEGLVVPVLKDADRKDVATLAQEIRDLSKRARNRELQLHELRGGSFTISNIGSIGGVVATPIINYPESSILALHKIEERPAVVDGAIHIRKRMYLSISFDHQVIDGADAARFMKMLSELLSNPTYLFTRI